MATSKFRRYEPTDIHWKLIEQRKQAWRTTDSRVWDEDEWVQAQALFCPYYAPLDGRLGSDWGVIVNPESLKFGQVVFEHEWCGCPGEEGAFDPQPSHGGGQQRVDEWAKPRRRPRQTRQADRLPAGVGAGSPQGDGLDQGEAARQTGACHGPGPG